MKDARRRRPDPVVFLNPISGLGTNAPKRLRSRFRRGRKLRRIAVFAAIPFLLIALIYMIFRPAGPSIEHDPSEVPIEEPVLTAAPVPEAIEEVIPPGETISDILTEYGLSQAEINQLVTQVKPVFDLKKIIAGRTMKITSDADGRLRTFDYPLGNDAYLVVSRAETGFQAERKAYEFETRLTYVDGVIEEHLYGTILAGGESVGLVAELEQIFDSDIDFYAGIQKGDAFRLLVEKKYLDGQFQKYGNILAAEFWNDGRTVEGFRFDFRDGEKVKTDYFHFDGRSLRKELLKSPLSGGRITSRFTSRRLHPIRKVYRAHYGVDYAAPIGTPVLATGDGKVTQAGPNGAAGRMVTIKHANGYETMYLHLNSILVKVGQRVEAKQWIGKVGTSGESTGPHLDYRIKRFGSYLNPLSAKFMPVAPLPAAFLPELQKKAAVLRLVLNSPYAAIRRLPG